MADSIEEIFNGFAAPFCFGQILVQKREGASFMLLHRDDASLDQLQTYRDAENAIEIAKYDDAGNYRPLKTAPNLRHGWRLELATVDELRRALDYFYPSSRFSRRGKTTGSKRRPCARHWIVSQECIVLPQKFPIHRSTILWRTFVGPIAVASELFYGNAIGMV